MTNEKNEKTYKAIEEDPIKSNVRGTGQTKRIIGWDGETGKPIFAHEKEPDPPLPQECGFCGERHPLRIIPHEYEDMVKAGEDAPACPFLLAEGEIQPEFDPLDNPVGGFIREMSPTISLTVSDMEIIKRFYGYLDAIGAFDPY